MPVKNANIIASCLNDFIFQEKSKNATREEMKKARDTSHLLDEVN